MITDRLPYAFRLEENGGADERLDTIIADQPARAVTRPPRKDLRPIIILTIGLCYAVTVGIVSITIVSINGSGVAKSCIETGGQWVIGESGARECVRKETR